MSSLLGRLLPPAVATSEVFTDPDLTPVYAQEHEAIAQAAETRRREFRTGRWCAREALAILGRPPAAIPRGRRGAPVWPAGVVGSITHCTGYRGAAVADGRAVPTLGIDAEPNRPVPAEVLAAVANDAERDQVDRLAAADRSVRWDRLLFSAKEAVYKAWFPLAGRWLGFLEAEVTFQPGGQTFSARLLVPGPQTTLGQVTGFRGRWLAEEGLLLTAVAGCETRRIG